MVPPNRDSTKAAWRDEVISGRDKPTNNSENHIFLDGGTEPGVADQHADPGIGPQLALNTSQIRAVVQVGCNNFHRAAGPLGESLGQGVEPLGVPCNQNQVVAAARQVFPLAMT
jgi:hypothetical protein